MLKSLVAAAEKFLPGEPYQEAVDLGTWWRDAFGALLDAERVGDPMGDLIQANRDELLRKHEEAVQRVRKRLESGDTRGALAVLDALRLFHPMHCESWCGWPEGTDA